jgi:hypothetical protein
LIGTGEFEPLTIPRELKMPPPRALPVLTVGLAQDWGDRDRGGRVLEIISRADFSGGMKIAWIVVALLFAPVAVPVWFLWVRRKDYSRA